MRTSLLSVFLVILTGSMSCMPGGLEAAPAPRSSDTMRPVISEIRVEEASFDMLMVMWKTDVPTIGRLEYGLPPDIDLGSPWTTELNTNGGIILTELIPLNTYLFRLRVRDAAGREAVSEEKAITLYQEDLSLYVGELKWVPQVTSAPPSPVISEMKVEEAAFDMLMVVWETDVPAIGRLEYGLPPNIDLSSPWTTELNTHGGIIVTELTPLSTYFFRVRVRDATGREAVSEDKVVTLFCCPLHETGIG